MQPVAGKPFTYTAPDLFVREKDKNLVLEPFHRIHDSRYMMYWLSMTEAEYQKFQDGRSAEERERLLLDRRTVDAVAPGEQQPEVDHQMENQNSYSGFHEGEGWRDARDGGYFQYNLMTGGYNDLSLMVRYWGNENGSRTFDILIDDQLLVTENVSGKWKTNAFVDVEYKIPVAMVKDKASVTVKFQCKGANIAGGVFYVRLLKPVEAVSVNSPAIASGNVFGCKNAIVIQNRKENQTAKIYNLTGILLKSLPVKEPDTRLEMPQGIYIVELSGERTEKFKVIVV
jgi:hypothetical protein